MGIVNELRDVTKLLVDAAKTLQTERESLRGPVFRPDRFIAVHERLGDLERDIKALRNAHRLAAPSVPDAWRQFVKHLDQFCDDFKEINLQALGIYAPDVTARLAQSYGWEETGIYYHHSALRHGCMSVLASLSPRRRRYAKLRRRFERAVGFSIDPEGPTAQMLESGDVQRVLSEVADGVNRCRELVATFLTQNWDPRDLSRR